MGYTSSWFVLARESTMAIYAIGAIVLVQVIVLSFAFGWMAFKGLQSLRWAKEEQAQAQASASLLGAAISALPSFVTLVKQADMERKSSGKEADLQEQVNKLRSQMSSFSVDSDRARSEWTEVFRKTFEDLRSEIMNLKKQSH